LYLKEQKGKKRIIGMNDFELMKFELMIVICVAVVWRRYYVV